MKCEAHHGQCGRPVYRRALCQRHYEYIYPPYEEGVIEKVYAKSRKKGECIIWPHSKGAPSMYLREGWVKIAREVWSFRNGMIPGGHHVVRVCGNPQCVRLEHLDAVPEDQAKQYVKATTNTGHKGIHQHTGRSKPYEAYIYKNRKRTHRKYFETLEEAVAWRESLL